MLLKMWLSWHFTMQKVRILKRFGMMPNTSFYWILATNGVQLCVNNEGKFWFCHVSVPPNRLTMCHYLGIAHLTAASRHLLSRFTRLNQLSMWAPGLTKQSLWYQAWTSDPPAIGIFNKHNQDFFANLGK